MNTYEDPSLALGCVWSVYSGVANLQLAMDCALWYTKSASAADTIVSSSLEVDLS
jgi:hypothetical protein